MRERLYWITPFNFVLSKSHSECIEKVQNAEIQRASLETFVTYITVSE